MMIFPQFRAQHPQGSIQTEMLPKLEGKFVFRAIITVNQTVLSTATAWDANLEAAEEKAIERALNFAGINHTPTPNTSIPNTPIPGSSNNTPRAEINNSANNNHRVSVLTAPLPTPPPTPPPIENNHHHYEEPEPDYYPAHEFPLLESIPRNSVPEDLSDEITQTKVEMERLGWTNEQGRDYLMRTFNKKSRQQLSTSELRQFLQYLQTQPPYRF